jgi:hypothetical protein
MENATFWPKATTFLTPCRLWSKIKVQEIHVLFSSLGRGFSFMIGFPNAVSEVIEPLKLEDIGEVMLEKKGVKTSVYHTDIFRLQDWFSLFLVPLTPIYRLL